MPTIPERTHPAPSPGAPRTPDRLRAGTLGAVLLALATLCLGASPVASGAASRFRVQRVCHVPRPRRAACMALRLLPASLTPAGLHADAVQATKAKERGATPAVTYKTPWPGYLTPQSLHAAYQLPTETASSAGQTIAVVDAYDDPTAEADLQVFDSQFGLPPCTAANGCFRKINQNGSASPLPPTEGGWASEISIDVQMAHAICQSCHVLLAEANGEAFSQLGSAVNAAVAAGASEISNSYGGTEQAGDSSYETDYYDHPGTVITASSGDCGYLNKLCARDPVGANFPADSADVVAVGGTSLTEREGVWSSTVWEGGGSGCSSVFLAPLWQSAVANFAATGCGSARSVADVAAIADPNTGVDVYDSTPEAPGAPTGWGAWGGTSVASPIVAAEYALAGGAGGVAYPGATLYSHLGHSDALYDVVAGSNGSCAGTTACQALAGFDGPTGVGSPIGLSAFSTSGAPVEISPPTVAGAAEQSHLLTESHGEWKGEPTKYAYQWERCSSAGSDCQVIAGQTAQTYSLTAADVGSSLRVAESASNAVGVGGPAVSAPTATVVSDVPKITGFTPSSAITGSVVTIEGTALDGAGKLTFGKLQASYTVLSPTQLNATVPDGAIAGRITLTTPHGTAMSTQKFVPTLSIRAFVASTVGGATVVTIKGLGFNSSSAVSFAGIPASSVTYVTPTKLKATVPAGAGTGAITVSNTQPPLGTVSSAASYTPG